MIRKSYLKAETVLNVLNEIAREKDRIEISCYKNGREDGFCAQMFHSANLGEIDFNRMNKVFFSENRNSDEIVVYIDSPSALGDSISDEAYAGKKFFDPYDYVGAASYIYTNLIAK